ncbi:MAG: hypothetical protein ACO3EU_07875, partial [Arenimonas sp.]
WYRCLSRCLSSTRLLLVPYLLVILPGALSMTRPSESGGAAAPVAGSYDAIIIAVAHEQFKAMGAAGIRAFGKPDSIIYDVKYVLQCHAVDGRL